MLLLWRHQDIVALVTPTYLSRELRFRYQNFFRPRDRPHLSHTYHVVSTLGSMSTTTFSNTVKNVPNVFSPRSPLSVSEPGTSATGDLSSKMVTQLLTLLEPVAVSQARPAILRSVSAPSLRQFVSAFRNYSMVGGTRCCRPWFITLVRRSLFSIRMSPCISRLWLGWTSLLMNISTRMCCYLCFAIPMHRSVLSISLF